MAGAEFPGESFLKRIENNSRQVLDLENDPFYNIREEQAYELGKKLK